MYYTVNAMIFSTQQFMELGLKTAGYDRWFAYEEGPNIDRFKKAYGPIPETVAAIWADLLVIDDDGARLTKKEAKQPINLLITLRWLWKYDYEEDLASFFKFKTPKPVSNKVKVWARKLQLLFRAKLGKLEDYMQDDLIFLFSIDGTHCPIEEPRPFSSSWSSHKFGASAGVNYEILVHLATPTIAWIYGPVPPGKYNDMSTFRNKLWDEMETLLPGKRIIGDKGYRGEPKIISTRNEFDPEELVEFKDRVLARHESVNQSIKCWKAMTEKWRHGVENHYIGFEAIACVVQYQIKNGTNMMFDPYLA